MLPLTAQEAQGRDLAVYIHWPFCKFKCPYCDFNSHVRDKVEHRDWQAAYLRELRHYRDLTGPREIQSVFFGGGTPSLMEPATVAAVIDEVARLWGLPQGAEITLEANPTSVETGKLQGFRHAGVNRVSLGVQALDDAALKRLGRQHSAQEGLAAVALATKVFDRFSFDLIYAREGQTLEQWRRELAQALAHAQGHMSLYQLTIEEGTQFHTLFQRGELTVPDEDTGANMYETTQEMMEAAGLPAYEVSNHARMGDASRHNMMYWRYRDYAGIGPGAHGRLTLAGRKVATRAHRAPEMWMERVMRDGHGAHAPEEISAPQRAREMLMMGLRLSEGLSLAEVESESGLARGEMIDLARLGHLVNGGFMTVDGAQLRATSAGRQRLNALLGYLLAA